ncbi:hypothetical protein Tco_0961794, partial [Tanacetum coccineum]
SGYLGGAVSGARKCAIEDFKTIKAGDSMRLRANRILNSGMVAVRDVDDVFNSVVVGMGTGALFKAASGVLSAALAGVIGGITVSSVVDKK